MGGGAYRFAVEVHVSAEGSARSGEGEHGQRYWNGHVDSDLSDVDVLDEFPGGGAVGGEDGRAVTVAVIVDQVDGVVERVDGEDHQNRAEDLLAVALHRSLRQKSRNNGIILPFKKKILNFKN